MRDHCRGDGLPQAGAMTRACVAGLVAAAVVAGLALRMARLDERPMHHDEANQAVKFGALLERGEYRYDAKDHHGPTLYYVSLPAARLRGQTTLATLDEWTLRGVTVAFGVVAILLLPLLRAGLGWAAVATSAWLMALSPAMVFYSRMYIHEALFACFALAFVIAVGRVVVGGGLAWAACAGAAAGLAVATKETAVVVIPAAVAASVVAWRWRSAERRTTGSPGSAPRLARAGAVAAVVGVAVAAVFYSSFLAHPAVVIEPVRALATYFDRGIDPATHAQPWHYYLGLLAYSSSGGLRWSEAVVLVLALVGMGAAWRTPDTGHPERQFWTPYFAVYVLITAAAFSAIRYKTPWNLLPFYTGAIVLAGVGFSQIVGAARSRLARSLLLALFALGSAHLGWQAWRASVTYAADPRTPYVYAQTVPDAVRMAARIRTLAALHPDGERMQVSVIASPDNQWPLPWYLRAMPTVGYWTAPGDAVALRAPIVVASLEHTAALDAALGDRYLSELYGLRPEVLLKLYIERDLWNRFMEADQPAANLP